MGRGKGNLMLDRDLGQAVRNREGRLVVDPLLLPRLAGVFDRWSGLSERRKGLEGDGDGAMSRVYPLPVCILAAVVEQLTSIPRAGHLPWTERHVDAK